MSLLEIKVNRIWKYIQLSEKRSLTINELEMNAIELKDQETQGNAEEAMELVSREKELQEELRSTMEQIVELTS